MRLVTQNLRHGGGNRISELVKYIAVYEPDIIAFTEFRMNKFQDLADACRQAGFMYFEHYADVPRLNKVAVASRVPLVIDDVSPLCAGCDLGHLLKFSIGEFSVIAAYIPIHKDLDTEAYFKRIVEIAHQEPILLLGDLNTGDPDLDGDGYKFIYSKQYHELVEAGLADCYRNLVDGNDVSWRHSRGKRRGFRIDHVLAAREVMERVTKIEYDHTIREKNLSDHSMLFVDID
ncbi:MAG: endonuclease/exonuclease/phosphatase family protein [Hyphomicrobiales bacterium]